MIGTDEPMVVVMTRMGSNYVEHVFYLGYKTLEAGEEEHLREWAAKRECNVHLLDAYEADSVSDIIQSF